MEASGSSFINIEVKDAAASARGSEAAAQALMEELSAIPRLQVGLADGGSAPAGSKAAIVSIAQLVIGLTASGTLLPTVVGVVRDWLVRQPPQTTLKIKDGDFEFEWSGATPPAAVEALLADLTKRRR